VRIIGNDIPGDKKIIIGLTQIRGIGYNFANAILDLLKIPTNSNIGYLSDSEIQSIEKILKNPSELKFPSWFLNRRKDIESGDDKHLLTSDITLTVRNDIEREKNTNSWRGYRHTFGLKVRGQRTRTTGRKGGAVGVAKGGKVLPPTAEGVTPAEGESTTPPAEGASPVEKKDAPVEKKGVPEKGNVPAETKKK